MKSSLRVLDHEDWTPDKASKRQRKESWILEHQRAGAKRFSDQVLTWREMGFNLSFREPDTYDKFESLPDWAKATLRSRPRRTPGLLIPLEQFENAADTRRAVECRPARDRPHRRDAQLHANAVGQENSCTGPATPQEALSVMIQLNNKYGLDGRDPNSYSGIFWVLGRYDRAWGPKRPVFGSVRYMTSDSARKKLRLKEYLATFGHEGR